VGFSSFDGTTTTAAAADAIKAETLALLHGQAQVGFS